MHLPTKPIKANEDRSYDDYNKESIEPVLQKSYEEFLEESKAKAEKEDDVETKRKRKKRMSKEFYNKLLADIEIRMKELMSPLLTHDVLVEGFVKIFYDNKFEAFEKFSHSKEFSLHAREREGTVPLQKMVHAIGVMDAALYKPRYIHMFRSWFSYHYVKDTPADQMIPLMSMCNFVKAAQYMEQTIAEHRPDITPEDVFKCVIKTNLLSALRASYFQDTLGIMEAYGDLERFHIPKPERKEMRRKVMESVFYRDASHLVPCKTMAENIFEIKDVITDPEGVKRVRVELSEEFKKKIKYADLEDKERCLSLHSQYVKSMQNQGGYADKVEVPFEVKLQAMKKANGDFTRRCLGDFVHGSHVYTIFVSPDGSRGCVLLAEISCLET